MSHAIAGRTPTMLGVWCLATGPLGLDCVLGPDHSTDVPHLSTTGAQWFGRPAPDEVPVQVTVGHLSPATVGSILTGDGQTARSVAALLREVADVLDGSIHVHGVDPDAGLTPQQALEQGGRHG